MFRVIALVAAVAAAGTLAGTASAHPPDLYDSSYSYGSTYTQPNYGGTSYGTTSYVAPSYSGSTYGTSAYVAPSYTGTSYGSTYVPTYNATPLYSKSYAPTRSYSSPSYGYGRSAGYGGYGYRGRTYVPTRNAYDTRPLPRDRHRSFGPISRVPTTEGLNVGYAGGPTYGTDQNPVINGVSLNGPPN